MHQNYDKYCFIRCYQSYYKSTEYLQLIFKQAIKRITPRIHKHKELNDIYFTHVAINIGLSDKFIGLNPNLKGKNVRVESLTNPLDKNDVKTKYYGKSIYYVLAYKLTDLEYDLLTNLLTDAVNNQNYIYDFRNLFRIALQRAKEEIGRFFNLFKKDKNKTNNKTIVESSNGLFLENEYANMLVCSSFVAYLLSKTSEDFQSYLKNNRSSIYNFSPNDVANIQGTFILFGGNWKDYNKDLIQFLKSSSNYKEFFKYSNIGVKFKKKSLENIDVSSDINAENK